MIRQHEELLTFALQLAKAAEAEILPYYQRCAVSLKADGTEVTEADRHAEAVMREMITHRFPTHAILGEEFGGALTADAPQQWIIDGCPSQTDAGNLESPGLSQGFPDCEPEADWKFSKFGKT
jgi:3'-phosphoadenosine 5'-phosphosulfate (PAPS) 3'-phosphatase